MFEFHEVIEFRRLFRREARSLLPVNEVGDVIFRLLRGFEARNGFRSGTSGDKFNKLIVCSNHGWIIPVNE